MSKARRLSADVQVTPFPWVGGSPIAAPVAPAAVTRAPAPVVRPVAPTPVSRQASVAGGAAQVERDAFAKGYEQGERAGLEAGGRRAEAMLRRMAETLEELNTLRQEMVRQTEHQLVQLALTIAKRIVRREVSIDPDLTVAMARVALDRIGEHTGATIRLHPEDYAVAGAQASEQLEGNHVKVVADEHVSRGACRIESAFGFVEAGVEAQFDEIEKAMLAEEPSYVSVVENVEQADAKQANTARAVEQE